MKRPKLPLRLKDLIPDARNANRGTERGAGMLRQSLGRFGAGRSILIDRKGRVIAGNKTLEQARAQGLEELIVVPSDGRRLVAVQRTDLDLESDPEAKALAIADNRVQEVDLEWDSEALAALRGEVDLGAFWSPDELAELLGEDIRGEEEAPAPRLDKALELAAAWQTAGGQLWEIPSRTVPGQSHRLACGDSSDPAVVMELFGGQKASLLATDPPYGVGFGVGSGPDSARRFGGIAGDEPGGAELQSFLESVFAVAVGYLREDAAWYLWHAQLTQGFFAAAAAAAQLLVHRQIIWCKSHFILGHGDFHWQHELCFYGWRQGHRARWFGDRAQSTVWHVANPRVADAHPTEKPLELFSRPILLNTLPGEVCFEPFSGSGTQLCAAEAAGRLCFGIEIEPKYVAVALQRLREMGLEPKKAGPGAAP